MLKSVVSYSLPLMGASLAGVALNSADQFYISRYYGTKVFAEFSNGAISIPFIGMIAGSVKTVILPILSKADSRGEMSNSIAMYQRAVLKSITLVFPILLFCMFFAGELVVFVYGAQYEVSKSFLRVYMLREFFNVIPYFSVILAMGLSNIYLNMHIAGVFFVWSIDYIVILLGLPQHQSFLYAPLFPCCQPFLFLVIFIKKQN